MFSLKENKNIENVGKIDPDRARGLLTSVASKLNTWYNIDEFVPTNLPPSFHGPPKNIFRKAKIFPGNVGDGEGEVVSKFFSKCYFAIMGPGLKILFQTSIFNTFRNSSIPRPHLGKLGPPFSTFLWGGGGCYTPTHPSK